MSALLGLALAVGVLLMAAPWLWPRGPKRPRPRAGRMHERLNQAGLGTVNPALVVTVSALLGLVVAASTFALLGVAAIALTAGAVGGLLPSAMIGRRARARRIATRAVWPDIVDQLVSTARSGLALGDGIVTLAHVGPAPTRAAFAQFEADYSATGSISRCLDELKERLADPVADRIIETVRMSREVGGSELTTVLRNLSSYLRQDAAIRSEVEARQSWVRNAARLGVAAPWAVLLLLSTRPEAAAAYNSLGGATLIVAGTLVTAVAYRLMIALGRLPEERRWLV